MFNGNYYGPSLADIAAVNRGNNGAFGMDGGWWAWILIFALFGWGNGGWGWNNGQNAGAAAATQADIQRGFDNQTVMGSLRGIEQGLCSLGYDQLAQMNGINNNITTSAFATQNAITQGTISNMQSFNALQAQQQNCRCENRAAIAQVRYDMATDTCSVVNAIKDASNAQMQNCNNNYRSLECKIDNLVLESKNQQIADLQMQLNRCDRDSALQGTASYIISQVRPTAQPSFIVPNPYTGGYGYNWNNWNGNGWCNQNNGCGCCA